ncbi:hypothetical protein DEO72_LG3g2303 [Vigna unguiculata]|uniref:Uncharacterized protein n=1 Tax=Vigna unguiculata TaxID=3917 RepID=A0A4D6LGX3_VIGUN|nr:hypothetical protein DEO72_LG3g2303 [Vigna unguiculata]
MTMVMFCELAELHSGSTRRITRRWFPLMMVETQGDLRMRLKLDPCRVLIGENRTFLSSISLSCIRVVVLLRLDSICWVNLYQAREKLLFSPRQESSSLSESSRELPFAFVQVIAQARILTQARAISPKREDIT